MAKNKRTIELTHEQLDHLVNGLLIVSGEYGRQYETLCQKFSVDKEQIKYWYDKSNMFYDLANDIKDGNFDV